MRDEVTAFRRNDYHTLRMYLLLSTSFQIKLRFSVITASVNPVPIYR